MAADCDLSVVIPAYREAENLRLLLPRLNRVLSSLQVRSEVLVIDTKTPQDETPQVCQDHGSRYVPRTCGNDYGDAVRTGLSAAAGEFILFMDADGSHAPEFIPNLWLHARSADVVIASRYVLGGGTENPISLILMSRLLNILYAAVLGIKCRDVSNSFKLYRADLIRTLPLRSRHFDVVEELLVRAHGRANPLKILEVPFLFKKRLFGETKRKLLPFILSFYTTLLKLFCIRLFCR
ncbi:MAG: glycosyltransferase [Verrucomicrobiae bacterium]|nr:glycosyltransferase [Verrucomicrobiae bacterium]